MAKQKFISNDPYYGVYDTTQQALDVMSRVGLDGKQVAI